MTVAQMASAQAQVAVCETSATASHNGSAAFSVAMKIVMSP